MQRADAVIHAGFSLDRKAFTPEEVAKAGQAEQDNVRTFIETLSGTAKTLIVTSGIGIFGVPKQSLYGLASNPF